jgi:DNA polymerase/3'-5' exonuclease PolX
LGDPCSDAVSFRACLLTAAAAGDLRRLKAVVAEVDTSPVAVAKALGETG